MKIVPRPYQYEAVQSVYDYFLTGGKGNPLICMPTATGKAVVIAMLMKRAFWEYPYQRIICVTHVKELVQQNYEKLIRMWPEAPAGINSAGIGRRDLAHPILFAGVASLINQMHLLGKVDLAIIDEAHLISTDSKSMYHRLFAHLKSINPNFKVIGLTATPFRLGQGMLTEEDGIFDRACYDACSLDNFNKFIEEGYLSRLIPKPTKTELDVDGVSILGGEFKKSELELAVDKQVITEAAIRETMEMGHDRKRWLVFASGIHHMESISHMLDMMGISNIMVHSKMPTKQRDENLARARNGEVVAAINYGVLTTGYDDPNIDLIVMLRPTASPGLWVQMLGRGTRVVYADNFDLNTTEGRLAAIANGPKPNCMVLDFAGNTKRLGCINDPCIPRKRGKGGGEAPVKLCHVCDTYNHASVRFCTNCGSEFTFEVKIKQQAGTDQLIKPSEFPIVETMDVNHISYQKYQKQGKPPRLRVTYYCEEGTYSDIVCFEDTGYALHRAHLWWKERSTMGSIAPATIDEVIDLVDTLKAPTRIKVWVNKKYPEIREYLYDENRKPSVRLMSASDPLGINAQLKAAMQSHGVEEDDIPF